MEEQRQYGFRVRPNFGQVLGYFCTLHAAKSEHLGVRTEQLVRPATVTRASPEGPVLQEHMLKVQHHKNLEPTTQLHELAHTRHHEWPVMHVRDTEFAVISEIPPMTATKPS